MGKLFQDIDFKPDFSFLSEAKEWVDLFNQAVGTALWFAIANKAGGDAWAWGLSYVVVSIAFGTSGAFNFNAAFDFVNVLSGNKNYVRFIFDFFFQILGCIAITAAGESIGLAAAAFAPSLKFSQIASVDFYKFFFGQEFFGIFLYYIFSKRSTSDIPASIWSILLVAVAFWVGGEEFGFIAARSFSTFKSFASASSWATFVCQIWSATVGAALLEYAWC